MGYQVYETPTTAGDGPLRRPCRMRLGRLHRTDRPRLAHKCEDHGDYVLMLDGDEISYDRFDDEPDAEEQWQERDGCGLYFCRPTAREPASTALCSPSLTPSSGKRTSSPMTPGRRASGEPDPRRRHARSSATGGASR